MSTLTQFFGSGGGGGSSSGMPVRVQIQEGGGGASCFCHYWTNVPNNSTYCMGGLISGRGGNHADLNLSIDPGAVCPITVGSGGASYSCPFTNAFTSPPCDPQGARPLNCRANCLCGKRGPLGGVSAFGSGSCCLGFAPGGTYLARGATCPIPPGTSTPTSTSPTCFYSCATITIADVEYIPYFDTSNLGPNPITNQNIPCKSISGALTTYGQNEGQRIWDSPQPKIMSTHFPAGTLDCNEYYHFACGCGICYGGNYMRAYGGGADQPAQITRWFGECAITFPGMPCACTQTPSDRVSCCNNNQYQETRTCCGGVVSTITGAVCAYGVGGSIREGWPRCINNTEMSDVLHCCDDHSRFRFPGSGAGGNTVWSCTCQFPTGPYSDGCPGSVIIQYPDEYAAATTSSPSVVDCSPNTPGSRTYKFLCPGSITFP